MELERARYLAEMYLIKYGLIDWDFKFDKASRRFGCCRHSKQEITLSRRLTALNDESQVTDTILHEIAHALVGLEHGHNKTWKHKAVELGCNGKRCYGKEVITQYKFIGTCPNCGRTIRRHKRRKCACRVCCNGTFNVDYMFTWERIR